MRLNLYGFSGKLISCNISKYRIKWDAKSKSGPQLAVKKFLRRYWSGNIVCEEWRIPGTLLKIDFINFSKNIAVEVHGRQHTEYVEFFHKDRNGYLNSFRRDHKKTEFIERNQFHFLEIMEDEVDLLTPEYILEKHNIKI